MQTNIAKAEMLVRRPPAEVFNAFVAPDKICQFWLQETSGPLAAGVTVKWTFMVPGASDTVTVTRFEEDSRISFDWSEGIHVDIKLFASNNQSTIVNISAEGFYGDAASTDAIAATEGFCLVLCELKVFLETGKIMGLVKEKAELIVRQNQSHNENQIGQF